MRTTRMRTKRTVVTDDGEELDEGIPNMIVYLFRHIRSDKLHP
jgi:hypothetical protein